MKEWQQEGAPGNSVGIDLKGNKKRDVGGRQRDLIGHFRDELVTGVELKGGRRKDGMSHVLDANGMLSIRDSPSN